MMPEMISPRRRSLAIDVRQREILQYMSVRISFRTDDQQRDREQQLQRIAQSQQAIKEGRVYSTKQARALLAKHIEKRRAKTKAT